MKRSLARTVLAGIAGGLALSISMFLTYRMIGFGADRTGFLLDPDLQSQKLIDIWMKEPIPMVYSNLPPIAIGLVVFGIIHAFLYRAISPAWPEGIGRRGVRMAAWTFLLVFLFWEFFTPFNQLHEPLPLIAVELLFWAIIAAADGFAIAVVMEAGRSKEAG